MNFDENKVSNLDKFGEKILNLYRKMKDNENQKVNALIVEYYLNKEINKELTLAHYLRQMKNELNSFEADYKKLLEDLSPIEKAKSFKKLESIQENLNKAIKGKYEFVNKKNQDILAQIYFIVFSDCIVTLTNLISNLLRDFLRKFYGKLEVNEVDKVMHEFTANIEAYKISKFKENRSLLLTETNIGTELRRVMKEIFDVYKGFLNRIVDLDLKARLETKKVSMELENVLNIVVNEQINDFPGEVEKLETEIKNKEESERLFYSIENTPQISAFDPKVNENEEEYFINRNKFYLESPIAKDLSEIKTEDMDSLLKEIKLLQDELEGIQFFTDEKSVAFQIASYLEIDPLINTLNKFNLFQKNEIYQLKISQFEKLLEKAKLTEIENYKTIILKHEGILSPATLVTLESLVNADFKEQMNIIAREILKNKPIKVEKYSKQEQKKKFEEKIRKFGELTVEFDSEIIGEDFNFSEFRQSVDTMFLRVTKTLEKGDQMRAKIYKEIINLNNQKEKEKENE